MAHDRRTWLAAACTAAAAYGAWGLIDRTISEQSQRTSCDVPGDSLPEMRSLVALIGTSAAGLAVILFLMKALGGWNRWN